MSDGCSMATERAQGIRDLLHALMDALPEEDLLACLSLLREHVEMALADTSAPPAEVQQSCAKTNPPA